ncbi:FG-GAP-like repeat-containing protein [Arenimonas oryziterrae]|uniref:FG-GAP-like repeat-containing protein n=1 Tax=Arenimonas oryziterrae TaxID=498055 RepID=UPI000406EE42|nr:FG-GAP-like repeat-containing protein [Arenimonas oryziterrae]
MALQNGAFTSSIAFDAPAFHGIEPKLALTYSSSGANGFAGVGWDLQGFSTIERAAPRRGSPRFSLPSSSDIFLLDGEELVVSTALGGTHVTLRQRPMRITGTAGVWTVTQPDGTVMTYLPTFVNNSKTLRWGLSTVVDTHGNTVSYNWFCDKESAITVECYPASVTYANVAITLNRADRTDIDTFATGYTLGKRKRLLKSVDVVVGGARARAYGLSYITSVRTSRSLLQKVQQFGRDATVISGVVTGGTALPATTMAWSDAATGFDAPLQMSDSYGLTLQIWQNSELYTDDFNGDGRKDFLLVYTFGGGELALTRSYLLLANASGFNNAVDITNQSGMTSIDWTAGKSSVLTGDFNGDGRADLLIRYLWGSDYITKKLLANTTGGFQTAVNISNTSGMDSIRWYSSNLVPADFNGDGRVDLLALYYWSGLPNASILYANASGGFDNAVDVTQAYGMTGRRWHAVLTQGDFNGDGRTDLVVREIYAGIYHTYLLMANPLGGFNNLIEISTNYGLSAISWYDAELIVGDYNGDGRGDILIHHWAAPAGSSYLLYAQGSDAATGPPHAYFDAAVNVTNLYGMNAERWGRGPVFAGDFNGDGRTDLLARNNVTAYPAAAYQLTSIGGNGFRPAVDITTVSGMTANRWGYADFRIADYDGDGDDDVLVHAYNGAFATPHVVLKGSSALSNQVTSIQNGYGGITEVDYLPSATWPAVVGPTWPVTGNPPQSQTVSRLTVKDGRGWSMATIYYYAGGAWDPLERRHLGFRQVSVVDPTGAHDDSYFLQGREFQVGELMQRNQYNAANAVTAVKYRLVEGLGPDLPNGPWVRNVTQDHDHEYNGDADHRERGKLFTYDLFGNVIKVVDLGDTAQAGDETTTIYDFAGNWGSFIVSKPANETVYAGNGTNGLMLKQTHYFFDGGGYGVMPTKGDVTREERWLNTTASYVATTYTYDGVGNRLTETDPMGNTSSTAWATPWALYPSSSTNALGHVTNYTWLDVCASKASEVDPNQATTSSQYDMLCRRSRETRADNGYTDYGYVNFGSAGGQYLSETLFDGQGGAQWKVSYFDGLGREWQAYNNVPEITESTYDARGLLAATSAPHLTGETPKWTTYTYDSMRRVTAVTFADGSQQRFLFGDWFTTTCDELGKPRTRYRDAAGRVVRVREFLGKTCVLAPAGTLGVDMFDTTISYDLLGQQVAYTDAKGNLSQSVFDSLGRRTSKTDPDMGAWSYTYDAAGRMTTQTDAKGQVIEFYYDAIGRVLSTQSAGAILTEFTYDCAGLCTNTIGRVWFARRGDVYNWYGYDAMGRVTGETLQVGEDISHTQGRSAGAVMLKGPAVRRYNFLTSYDGAGRVRTQTYPNNEVLTYGYDVAGRVTTLSSSLFATPLVTATSYDARGHMTSRTLGSGAVETFTYDADRLWLKGVTVVSGGSTLHSVTFPRNARGEVTSRSNALLSTDNWAYLYDDLRRLTSATNSGASVWSESFGYDEIGRMTSSSRLGPYAYAPGPTRPLHAPSSIGYSGNTTTLAYDANGNMTSDGSTSIFYDAENRPISVGGIAMQYDANGKRMKIGNTIQAGELYEDDLATATQTRYYFFNGVRLASAKGTAGTYYHGDQLNSATTLSNFAGQLLGRQVLSPYGRRLASDHPSDPIGLAGQRLDATGLYHMGAREMNPSLGIFVTPDPSSAPDPERPQTLNRYAYANNSPTNLVDPSGFEAENPESAYDTFSKWTHRTLSVAGVIPGLGIVPDVVDLVFTAVEVPFGKSTWTDVGLATVGVAATFIPVAGDGAAAAAKIAAREAGSSLLAKTGREAATVAAKSTPTKPSAYSVAFETKLDPTDFGRRRSVHFNRANAALDTAMKADPSYARMMEEQIPGISARVSSVGGRKTPAGWTWEHASSSTAFGQSGVMRLVPSAQHTPSSPFWRTLHPDAGAKGGYAEWAVPAGAPANKK